MWEQDPLDLLKIMPVFKHILLSSSEIFLSRLSNKQEEKSGRVRGHVITTQKPGGIFLKIKTTY